MISASSCWPTDPIIAWYVPWSPRNVMPSSLLRGGTWGSIRVPPVAISLSKEAWLQSSLLRYARISLPLYQHMQLEKRSISELFSVRRNRSVSPINIHSFSKIGCVGRSVIGSGQLCIGAEVRACTGLRVWYLSDPWPRTCSGCSVCRLDDPFRIRDRRHFKAVTYIC